MRMMRNSFEINQLLLSLELEYSCSTQEFYYIPSLSREESNCALRAAPFLTCFISEVRDDLKKETTR